MLKCKCSKLKKIEKQEKNHKIKLIIINLIYQIVDYLKQIIIQLNKAILNMDFKNIQDLVINIMSQNKLKNIYLNKYFHLILKSRV